jgi:hypothetical protein
MTYNELVENIKKLDRSCFFDDKFSTSAIKNLDMLVNNVKEYYVFNDFDNWDDGDSIGGGLAYLSGQVANVIALKIIYMDAVIGSSEYATIRTNESDHHAYPVFVATDRLLKMREDLDNTKQN